ncbi:hypothetical protein E0494_04585 [Marinilabiliaceae bacterium JC040]|nr:hypothetical protein [Marinilabiliaceae bacterium JC040]
MNLHYLFLSREYKSIIDIYRKKLQQRAVSLLKSNEIFIGKYIGLTKGQLLLQMRTSRSLPRKNDYYLGFIISSKYSFYADYRNWNYLNYFELLSKNSNNSEVRSLWYEQIDSDFSLVAFSNVNESFIKDLKKGCLVILGPNKPPIEYVKALLTYKKEALDISKITKNNFRPIPLNNKNSISLKIKSQLVLNNKIIILGPPGTGKSYLISELIAAYLNEGASVLATALTNKALLELASKAPLAHEMEVGNIYKSNLSLEEKNYYTKLLDLKSIYPQKNKLHLVSFYNVAENRNKILENIYDVIVVDEASQAFLAFLEMVMDFGQIVVFVGDNHQLPPILTQNSDDLDFRDYDYLYGLESLLKYESIPSYILTYTHRLSKDNARLTSIFYPEPLKSLEYIYKYDKFMSLSNIGYLFPEDGGTIWVKQNLEKGKVPKSGISFIIKLITEFYSNEIFKKFKISILSYFKNTIQKINYELYNRKLDNKNLHIDTVSRIQGETCDVCIYFIPNEKYLYTCEEHLFNVATSRARMYTIIITDELIVKNLYDNKVVKYFESINYIYEISNI